MLNKSLFAITAALMSSTALADNYPLETANLNYIVYNGDAASFNVNATLLYGETEAVLIDTGFTKADALRLTANILDSGKTLTMVFISQADPDFYFGAEVIHQYFPEAKIVTTPKVKQVIESKLDAKLAYWPQHMGANAPKQPYMPEVYSLSHFSLDGVKVEIKGADDPVLAHRPYLWIPQEKVLLGNVAIYAGLHLWMADAQTEQEQSAWAEQLNQMKALEPAIVIPGHMTPGTSLYGNEAIDFSIRYLETFKQRKQQSHSGQELMDKMNHDFPDLQSAIAISIGSKVHMGEMKW